MMSCPAQAGHPVNTDGAVITGSSAFADDDERRAKGVDMRRTLAFIFSGMVAMSSANAQSLSQSEVAQKLAGAWRYVGTTVDGKPRAGRGDNPKGMIYYTAGGYMSAQIAPDRARRKAGAEMTPEEAKDAL